MLTLRHTLIIAASIALAACTQADENDVSTQSPEINAGAIDVALREGPTASGANAAQPEFRRRIAAAYQAEDKIAAIAALFYLEETDEEVQKMYFDRSIPMLARSDVESIGFEDLPDDFRGDYALEGYRYEPNPTPIGYVVLNEKTRAPYGEIGGKYYFLGMKRTLITATPLPEQTVQASVIGMGSPPVRYEGSCEVLRSDEKTDRHDLEDSGIGNTMFAMNAAKIETCTLRKLSEHGSLSLRVIESDETLFEETVDGVNAELVYRAK